MRTQPHRKLNGAQHEDHSFGERSDLDLRWPARMTTSLTALPSESKGPPVARVTKAPHSLRVTQGPLLTNRSGLRSTSNSCIRPR
jgi:hypothetical protein